MSNIELTRLDYVKRVIEKRLTQVKAAEELGLCTRQIQRLTKQYKQNSCNGLISRKRSQVSNNITDITIRTTVLSIINKHYNDFGPTLVVEKLATNHNYKFAVETIRKWMTEAGFWVPRKYKLKRAYQPRYRRNCYGELIQIDGS